MLIDSHSHLDMDDFDRDRHGVIDRAVEAGITHIITVGIDLESSLAALELAKNSDVIRASVGCHPHNADGCNMENLDKLVSLASEPEIVAWGEIGLDYYRDYSSREGQTKIFLRQLEIAVELNLPAIIHDREAHEDVLDSLKKMGKGHKRGVIHCFSGDADLAREFIGLGYYISIPGTVTYKKAAQLRAVASQIPLESMLIETDAPFLTPVPKRGKRNEPAFVAYTAGEIARIRDMDVEEVGRVTSENANTLFGLQ